MSDSHSVTYLIHQLEAGNSAAAKKVWDRFIHQLIGLARKRLQGLPRRALDEEDIAVSAFNAFFQGVEENRFERLNDRDDLWQVLAMLAERKAIGALRRELADKRGGGVNRGESVFEQMIAESSGAIGIQGVADPSPMVVDDFTSSVREMLESIGDDTAQTVALHKLSGMTNKEIAAKVGISLRAVERKLAMIRKKWERI
jgi:RNA polymerase sigma factor (sigma-70 family)